MLLSLPTELIILVLTQPRNLKPTDLYRVSLTCHLLKAIALPIFLSHCGIRSSSHITLHIPRWNPSSLRAPDALMGLNLATYITNLEVLKCFFQDPSLTTSRNVSQKAEDLTYAVKRISRFVRRVKVVKHAVISLVWDPYYIAPNASFIPVDKLNAWSTHLTALLNTLVEKKCESLTVQYRSMFEPAFQFRQTGWVKKTFNTITRQGGAFLHSIKDKDYPRLYWEYDLPAHLNIEDEDPTRSILHPTISPMAQEANWLTVMRIHSDVLLRPPILQWTLGLLRNAQHIAELSFAHVLCGNEEWRVILNAIKEVISRQLCVLMLGVECPGLEGETIVEFLTCLGNLTHLSVAKPFSRAFKDLAREGRSRVQLEFPRLKVLVAPLDFAQLVLGYPHPNQRRRSSLDRISGSPTRNLPPSRQPHRPSLSLIAKPPCPSLTKLTLYPTGFGNSISGSSESLRSHFRSCKEISEFVKFINDQGRVYSVYVTLDVRWEVGELRGMVEAGEEFRRDLASAASTAGNLPSVQAVPLSTTPPASPISSNSDSANSRGSQFSSYTGISELVLIWSPSRLRDLSPRMLGRWIGLYVPNLLALRIEGAGSDSSDTSANELGQGGDGLRDILMDELRAMNRNRQKDEVVPGMRVQALVIGGRRVALDVST